MSGAQIAAEVAAGLAEAGAATGNGPLVSTLRKRSGPDVPWSGLPLADADATVTAVQIQRKERDGQGMVLRTVQMLLIEATGAVPVKGDRVALGVLPADVEESTKWLRLGEIETVAPGGVAVLYKAMLEG